MDQKELLKKVRVIQIKASHMVDDVLAGEYSSVFKGRGMEFDEVRQYIPGDEIRTIDWNVTARTGVPHVKRFVEERELTVVLLVDLSSSGRFGTFRQLKSEIAAEICALLAFSAIRNQDKVGLILFTDRVEKFVSPRKGTSHVLRVIRELLAYKPEGRGTNIAVAMEHLNRIMRRKAVVFLISDFQDSRYEQPLRITRQSHDLILIAVNDRREQEIPNLGLIELEDGETGRRIVVDTSSARWRRKYQQLIAEFIESRDGILRRSKLDVIHINTGESFVEPLTRFFRRRELRR